MPVPEPLGNPLWQAVKPLVAGGWIDTDEDTVHALGNAWTHGGNTFGDALLGGGADGTVDTGQHLLNLHDSWSDSAGRLWQQQVLQIGEQVREHSQFMHLLAAHVGRFADDVAYTKQQIVDAVNRNTEVFNRVLAMPGGAGTAVAQNVINSVAGAVNDFIGAMAAQIAGRTTTGLVPAERPALDVDKDADHKYDQIGTVADVSGGISSAAAAGALITADIPPLAAVLGIVSLAGAGLAALGHGAKFVHDPSLGNGLALATDGLAIVPGVRGINAAAKATTGAEAAQATEAAGNAGARIAPANQPRVLNTSPHSWINIVRDGTATPTDGWVRIAARFSDNPVDTAYGLQAGSNALPAVDTFAGLALPSDPDGAAPTRDEILTRGTVEGFLGRVVDNLPHGRIR
jgi:hypothetical protein